MNSAVVQSGAVLVSATGGPWVGHPAVPVWKCREANSTKLCSSAGVPCPISHMGSRGWWCLPTNWCWLLSLWLLAEAFHEGLYTLPLFFALKRS